MLLKIRQVIHLQFCKNNAHTQTKGPFTKQHLDCQPQTAPGNIHFCASVNKKATFSFGLLCGCQSVQLLHLHHSICLLGLHCDSLVLLVVLWSPVSGKGQSQHQRLHFGRLVTRLGLDYSHSTVTSACQYLNSMMCGSGLCMA